VPSGSNDALLTPLGCATDANGWVVVDGAGRTSVPGVWAAGNAVNPRAQVVTAAGEGSAAAIAINNDLVEEDIGVAVVGYRQVHPAPSFVRPPTPSQPLPHHT